MWLALHGFTGTGKDWEPVFDGRPHVAPDLHGHGTGPHPEAPYRMEDVVLRLAREYVGRLHLVGYSMGGRVALHLALLVPSRVERLVLFGATPGVDNPRERDKRAASDQLLAEHIETEGVSAFADSWERVPILASQQRIAAEIREPMRARRRLHTPNGLAGALRGYGTGAMPSVWHRLHELTMPVTLVTGSEDPKFTAIARRMATLLPKPEHIVIEGAGHTAHLERIERAREILFGPE